ncbi:uncharacterized protein N7511_005433 [Penicillium nucicola]|uniref:uncharacterized protein n=1 Tax=Penicillium nucicola TaxID=1850975 RepID=UPI002544FFCF|nr:uncharacterized protein N7511_005433 [Penicillium nucicola]KAJ5762051.1 hypothetical protein N7511_005433 [Penicillium nucicola]
MVKQLNQPAQNHTNALVLEYLLRPETTVALLPDQIRPSKSDGQRLLDFVSSLDPPAQVILDVGAQILELGNLEVAKHWLNMLPCQGAIEAVVFVNDTDEVCVVGRNGRVEPLQTSPFARKMEACYVFLDESHTRGIDLKLPATYRAAVTLGPGITKDKLVQACMRMRNFGNGQSVVFCIPSEIQFKIRALCGNEIQDEITVSDVLCWAVSETWIDLSRAIPLWAIQGKRFEYQLEQWNRARVSGPLEIPYKIARKFLEEEGQTIERRYRPGHIKLPDFLSSITDNENLRLISERCAEFGNLNLSSTALNEEQERELAPEIECQCQVERPRKALPRDHFLHQDLVTFVNTGYLKEDSNCWKPAFKSLKSTSASSFLDVSQFPSSLLVTREFAKTIKTPKTANYVSDSFQRSVRWILTTSLSKSPGSQREVRKMVIISPFEANCLLEMNLSFPSLDQLDLYTVPEDFGAIIIPETLQIQLNLFAGQLYLNSYIEYQSVCQFLGLSSVGTSSELVVAADGFIMGGKEGQISTFHQSPLKFLKVLLSQIRKDSQSISKTHMGKILEGELLTPADFLNTSHEVIDLDEPCP